MKIYSVPDLSPKNSRQEQEMAQEKMRCYILTGFNLESEPKCIRKHLI